MLICRSVYMGHGCVSGFWTLVYTLWVRVCILCVCVCVCVCVQTYVRASAHVPKCVDRWQ
jgi:hypothetical protein